MQPITTLRHLALAIAIAVMAGAAGSTQAMASPLD